MNEPQQSGGLLGYVGYFDRATERRGDEVFLEARRAHATSIVVPIWQGQNVVQRVDGQLVPRFASGDAFRFIMGRAKEVVFLGMGDGGAVFAADVSNLEAAEVLQGSGGDELVELRQLGSLVTQDAAALLAYARAMMHWHLNQQYCGHCGTQTISREAGHIRVCTGPSCAREIHPRTDPVVIMLVEHRDPRDQRACCLLGRHTRLPAGLYSTLAGFVEPGESLEAAVAREVYEEAGVRVRDVTYRASQPWPFPASLMLGFHAYADDRHLEIDRHELDDARWFSIDELATFGEWGDDDTKFRLPRRDSIARFLIDSWIAETV